MAFDEENMNRITSDNLLSNDRQHNLIQRGCSLDKLLWVEKNSDQRGAIVKCGMGSVVACFSRGDTTQNDVIRSDLIFYH